MGAGVAEGLRGRRVLSETSLLRGRNSRLHRAGPRGMPGRKDLGRRCAAAMHTRIGDNGTAAWVCAGAS